MVRWERTQLRLSWQSCEPEETPDLRSRCLRYTAGPGKPLFEDRPGLSCRPLIPHFTTRADDVAAGPVTTISPEGRRRALPSPGPGNDLEPFSRCPPTIYNWFPARAWVARGPASELGRTGYAVLSHLRERSRNVQLLFLLLFYCARPRGPSLI